MWFTLQKTSNIKNSSSELDEDYFYFKGFKLRNRDAQLKINTDGVLLAAWSNLSNNDRILDVGTASGVIAHILAYRNKSLHISGIDIDQSAIEEANFNAKLNELGQLKFQCISLQKHVASDVTYDHIISNPPYFNYDKDNMAKHDSQLTLEELFECSTRIVSPRGRISIIIPKGKEAEADIYANKSELHKVRRLQVRGKESGPVIRSLLEYSKLPTDSLSDDELYIRADSSENSSDSFGPKYKNITSFLYLNF